MKVIGIYSLGKLAREDAAQHDDGCGVSAQHNGSSIFSVAAINDTLHRGRKPGLQLSQRLAPLGRILRRHVALVKGREQGFED